MHFVFCAQDPLELSGIHFFKDKKTVHFAQGIFPSLVYKQAKILFFYFNLTVYSMQIENSFAK